MHTPCDCHVPVDLADLLDSLAANALGPEAHGCAPCPQCGANFEFQLRRGHFSVGYSYWAGSMHFEAIAEESVKGLAVTPREPDDLDVEIDERRWTFQRRHMGARILAIFDNVWAAGRSLREIDLEALGVTVEGVERNWVIDPAFTRDMPLEAGQRLHLRGHSLALNRAWQHLLKGPAPAIKKR